MVPAHNVQSMDLGKKDVNTLSIYLFKIVMGADDTIKSTIDELYKVLSAKNITGDPIEMEDKIIIPIIKMGMGFGTKSIVAGENKRNCETSGGAGGGIGISPAAVVIVFKGIKGPDGIRVVPLGTPSALSESLVEMAAILKEKSEGEKKPSKKSPDDHTAITI